MIFFYFIFFRGGGQHFCELHLTQKVPRSLLVETEEIHILIGSDLFWDLILVNDIIKTNTGVTTINTSLGWTVQQTKDEKRNNLEILFCGTCENKLEDRLKMFWEV